MIKSKNIHKLYMKILIFLFRSFFICQSLLIVFNINMQAQSVKPIPKVLNICSNIFDEFAPTLSADGKTLIFQSNKDGQYKLYECKLQSEGQWSTPLPLNEINNFGKSKDLVAGPNLSNDGNMLYFCASYEKGYGDLDIYSSVKIGQNWSKPFNIGQSINTKGYEGFPSISADGNKLYYTKLAENSKDGLDCFKIMVAEKDVKGNWSNAKELPFPINTGCDKAPRIMSDNKTLIFASNREGGKGKFDLYTSKLNLAGEWSTPLSMDFVNTPDFEQYATVAASGDYMLYYNNNNIVSVEIPFIHRQNKNIAVKGNVTDLDTKLPIDATITIIDIVTREVLSTTYNNPTDGSYALILTAGKTYEVLFKKPDYSIHKLIYDLTNLEKYQEYQENVQLFNKVNFELSVIDFELYFPVNAQIVIKNLFTQEVVELNYQKLENGSKVYEIPIGSKLSFLIKAKKCADYSFDLDLTSDIKFKSYEKEVEMSPFKRNFALNITDFDTGEGLLLDVIVTNLDLDEQFVTQAYLSRDGKHAINLREGNRYNIEVKNPKGYAFYATQINTDDENTNTGLNISLLALKPNAKLLLKEIFFEYNSYELKDASLDEIKRLIKLLKVNANLVVEVAAHTDNIGSEVFNKKLSDLRAKYVVNYMRAYDIPGQRLKAFGYGKNVPISPNDTEENRLKNRRLEVKVITN